MCTSCLHSIHTHILRKIHCYTAAQVNTSLTHPLCIVRYALQFTRHEGQKKKIIACARPRTEQLVLRQVDLIRPGKTRRGSAHLRLRLADKSHDSRVLVSCPEKAGRRLALTLLCLRGSVLRSTVSIHNLKRFTLV